MYLYIYIYIYTYTHTHTLISALTRSACLPAQLCLRYNIHIIYNSNNNIIETAYILHLSGFDPIQDLVLKGQNLSTHRLLPRKWGPKDFYLFDVDVFCSICLLIVVCCFIVLLFGGQWDPKDVSLCVLSLSNGCNSPARSSIAGMDQLPWDGDLE